MLLSLDCSISPWFACRRSLLSVRDDLFSSFLVLLIFLYITYRLQALPQPEKGIPPILTQEGKKHKNLPEGIKQGGWWQAILEKRKIIWSKMIKTAYNKFHSPLPIRPSPNQVVLGRHLPRLSSYEPHNVSHNKIH